MKNDDLKKKDWQLLIGHSNIQSLAYLRTILEAQISIIAKLDKIDEKIIAKQMNDVINDNLKLVNKQVEDEIPDYPPIG